MDPYLETGAFYDHVVPYREREDVSFWVDLAREASGPVLELGCGTGRVSIPTAEAGCEIVGLDASPSMLTRCREKRMRLDPAVSQRLTLVEGDLRSFELGRRFALVTTPFRVFQHLVDVEDQIAALQRIHAHLETGGRFVLDVFNPYLPALATQDRSALPMIEPEFTLPDGRRVVRSHRIHGRDHVRQVTDVELQYLVTHPDGREETRSHRFEMRHFFRYEAEHLLERCGLRVDRVLGGYDGRPFGSDEPGELIVLAHRPEITKTPE